MYRTPTPSSPAQRPLRSRDVEDEGRYRNEEEGAGRGGDRGSEVTGDLFVLEAMIEHDVDGDAVLVVVLLVGDVEGLLKRMVRGYEKAQRKVFTQLGRYCEPKAEKAQEDDDHHRFEDIVADRWRVVPRNTLAQDPALVIAAKVLLFVLHEAAFAVAIALRAAAYCAAEAVALLLLTQILESQCSSIFTVQSDYNEDFLGCVPLCAAHPTPSRRQRC